MKLEYLEDITDGGKYPQADPDKLIRLYDFDAGELASLKRAITENLIDRDGELVVSNLKGVQALNCTLTLRVAEEDSGVRFPSENNVDFFGAFSKSTYVNMLDIIDGIENGYNWLYDPEDESQIDLLLSSGVGSW